MAPCTKDRITNQGSWFCSDYALGFIDGWGVHPLDVAVWGMDADTKGPFAIRGKGVIATPDALFNTYTEWDVDMIFANGVTMHFMNDKLAMPIVKDYALDSTENGTTFFGTKGWVSIGRSSAFASDPEWLKLRQCEGNKRVTYNNRYYKSFVESVRDRSPSIGPIDDAIRSDALSHLSVLAMKNDTEIVWDPLKYEIKSPTAINAQMNCAVRGDWKQS